MGREKIKMNKKILLTFIISIFLFSFASAGINVTLNSPSEEIIDYFKQSEITFNATANIEGEGFLKNLSLCGNFNEIFECVETRIAEQSFLNWTSNSTRVTGLPDLGLFSTPTVFTIGEYTYLISGETEGVFYGYVWTGSSWTSNSTIVTGLGDVGAYSTPTVFTIGEDTYLISGEDAGVFNGYVWTGSSWTSNSTIVTGLGDVGIRSTPTVFTIGEDTYLISGEDDGVFYGYVWTGSSWTSNSTIVTGLGDVGIRSAPTVFTIGEDTYLISGRHIGDFIGYKANKIYSSKTQTEIFSKYIRKMPIIWNFKACDNFGNCSFAENNNTLSAKIFFNNLIKNNLTYETAEEILGINITANSSLAAVHLNYNGTEYDTTKSGDIWRKSIEIPVGETGNNSIKWKFTYGEDTIYSDESYQTVEETIFTKCNTTYNNTYLTLKFKDEASLSFINATIPTSTFKYYLGSGSQYKTYTYTNTSLNPEYNFCAYPNRTLNINPYVQYKQGTEYPQRIWDADVTEYNSTATEKILYLLNSLDGIYVTFQVINSAEQGIDGVSVVGTRTIEGETVIVADGETGAGGGVTFWLNPDFIHNFKFTKEGYEDYIIDITPTQATYTVTLGGEQEEKEDYLTGISINVNPAGEFLKKNEVYNFLYNIEAQNSNLESYGFTLKADSSIIETQIGTNPSGEELNYAYNISTAKRITMEYYYVINGTTRSYIASWNTYQPNDFSIKHFLDNLVSKIDNNLFGITGDDNGVFAKSLLSLLILIVGAGLISSRYGLASEQAVSGILFGMILFLNTINFFPTLPESFPIQVDLGTTIIFISATWLVISIFKEESR